MLVELMQTFSMGDDDRAEENLREYFSEIYDLSFYWPVRARTHQQ